MLDNSSTYGRAFADVLFFGPRSDNVRELGTFGQISLYFLTSVFFYLPILYFIIKLCVADTELIPYFIVVIALHALAKVMLYNSKRVQTRFATIKHKNLPFRIWLMIEHIAFMWLVYLFYPMACILAPFSLLAMSVESLLGGSGLLNLFLNNARSFFMVGGIAAYVLFILADGYKKIKTGFMPDYMVLYALLAMISGSIEKLLRNAFEFLNLTVDIGNFTTGISDLFVLSNNSMNIVATVMMAIFALRSLYNNCGIVPAEKTEEPYAPPDKDSVIVYEDS